MTRQQVRQNMDKVLRLMRQEQDLRLELSALDFSPASRPEVAATLAKQKEIIAQISEIRMGKILPIVREMVAFIASKTQGCGTLKAAVR